MAAPKIGAVASIQAELSRSGAISSRPFCLASGPSCVTAAAAITSTVAEQTNTVVRPQPVWIHGIARYDAGRRQAADTGGPAEARRARVGREHLGSEDLHRVAGDLDAEDHDEAGDQQLRVACAALANTIAMMPAATNAQIDVIFRP